MVRDGEREDTMGRERKRDKLGEIPWRGTGDKKRNTRFRVFASFFPLNFKKKPIFLQNSNFLKRKESG